MPDDSNVVPFDRQERLAKATQANAEIVDGIEEEVLEDSIIEYCCSECESENFTMMGMDGTDIVMLYCAECHTPVDGSFLWKDVGIQDDP